MDEEKKIRSQKESYGDFNQQVKVTVDKGGGFEVDLESALNHPRFRYNMDLMKARAKKEKEGVK